MTSSFGGLANGVGRMRFRLYYKESLLVGISRLLQSIYRERYAGTGLLRQDLDGRWWLLLGNSPVLRVPVTGVLPFQRIDVTDFPSVVYRDRTRVIKTSRGFLIALGESLSLSKNLIAFDRLTSDFENSLSNLVLNRILYHVNYHNTCALEPLFEGHLYYPFPALRLGPSLRQIVACSNLSGTPAELLLVSAKPCRFISNHYEDYQACASDWAGDAVASESDPGIPVHPWQIELSPVLRLLLRLGMMTVAKRGLPPYRWHRSGHAGF